MSQPDWDTRSLSDVEQAIVCQHPVFGRGQRRCRPRGLRRQNRTGVHTAKAGQEKERVRMRLEVTLAKLVMESVVLEPVASSVIGEQRVPGLARLSLIHQRPVAQT